MMGDLDDALLNFVKMCEVLGSDKMRISFDYEVPNYTDYLVKISFSIFPTEKIDEIIEFDEKQ